MHSISARFVIACRDNSTSIRPTTNSYRQMTQRWIIAHLYRGKETIGITMNNFSQRRCLKQLFSDDRHYSANACLNKQDTA